MPQPTRHNLRLYGRLLSEAKPYAPLLVLAMLLSLLSTPLGLLTPLPLKIVVDCVLGGEPLPGFLAAILPSTVSHSTAAVLTVALLLLLLVTLCQHAEGFASWVLQLYVGERMVLGFRSRLFRQVQRLSLRYHDASGVADSLYRIQNDAPAIQYLIVQGLIGAVTSVLTVAAMVYVSFRIDAQLAVVAIAIVPILMALIALYRRRVRGGWDEVKKLDSSAMSVIQEALAAVRVVKAFGQEHREQQRFAERAGRSLWSQIRVVLLEAGFGILIALTLAAGTAVVLYLGVRHVQIGRLTTGDLLVVMAYLGMLYRPLETLSKKVASLQSSLASAERAYTLFDQAPEVPEPAAPRPLKRARGEIAFEDVNFSYRDGTQVLANVSFHLRPGMSAGISGATGAGKSTLVSLLLRFFDPLTGRILLDGFDLREYRLADLRNQIGVVLQEPVLFATTIAENIAYGRPDATHDQITQAARAAHAHDFISAMPEGYQTNVGERGMCLSGGERQRISLARAFLKDAPILILDEPTSSVDVESERLIMRAMHVLMRDRTTIMIAHRLSTLERCNLRLHLEYGRLLSLPVPRDHAAAVTS